MVLQARPPAAAPSDAGGVETSGEAEVDRRSATAGAAAAAATAAAAAADTTAAPPEPEPETAAAAAAAGVEEAGLDMSDFEDLLLDHLKTTDYPAGEYIFRSADLMGFRAGVRLLDGGLCFRGARQPRVKLRRQRIVFVDSVLP